MKPVIFYLKNGEYFYIDDADQLLIHEDPHYVKVSLPNGDMLIFRWEEIIMFAVGDIIKELFKDIRKGEKHG